MRKTINFTILTLLLSLVMGCSGEDSINPNRIVDENGLTRNITDLVPEYILEEMKSLGMPIYGGVNPPIIEGSFYGAPMILLSSNRPSDSPGMPFTPYEVTFSNQDDENLMLRVDYVNGAQSGSGIGSFIVGNDCEFSVFVEINTMHTNGATAQTVQVISGKFINNGIEDLHLAFFMIDDNGDPEGILIENGEGRIVYDQDGFTEEEGTEGEWYDGLPDCPCQYSDDLAGKQEMCGEWLDCGSASQSYHYGATYEIRWVPSDSDKPGQQCTYDANKKLITSGIAAGSPDKDSPNICGFGDVLTGQGFPDIGHYFQDVVPWKDVPCWQYLRDWPANNGNNCEANAVSDIAHMSAMVRTLTCQEVTLVIKSAKEDTTHEDIDSQLRSYILGSGINLTNAQLIEKLSNWKERLNCVLNFTLCGHIDKMIVNLQ